MPTSAVSSMSRSLARERESGDSESEDADARSSLMWCWRARAPHGFHMLEESDDPESNGFAASDDGTSETSDERILDMEGKLSESQDARQEAEEHLKRIDDAYNKRRKELEESISELKEQLEEQHQELDRLEAEDGKMVNSFPGPRCLRWVEGDVFTVASTAVVLLNVIIIVREILDEPSTARWPWTNHHGTRPPSDKLDRFRRVCFVLDQAFLVFYLMEFTLRGLLMQHKLLCGELGEVIWNWLDLLIVVVGVIDQWILPEISDHTGGSNFGSAIRILRLLRLLRLMKVLKALLQSDLEWVEEDGFQGFVLFAILLNSILLGLQTDMPDFFLWNIFEGFLLLIFSFEIVVRIKHHGRDFFLDCQEVFWNMLDLLIVVSAVIDNWLFPIVDLIMVSLGSKHGLQADSAGMGIITLLRVVRLFRILRLARLIHSLPPLQDLVCGVVQAMHGMFWVLVLTCLMLFCSSILAMTLIEKEMLFADGEMPKNLKGLFPDVGQSMFVLFLVMNSDFEPVQDLLSQVPVSQLFIALFIVISNWAILAIFTAVVSENMITTVENRRMKLEKDESTYRTDRSLVKLKEFFEEIKPGEHELIYTHEFTTFLNDPDKEAELCDAAGISSQDLKDLLKLLSHKPVNNDRSYILEKDFLSGLKQQNDAANERSMMRLEKQIMALEDRLRHWMEEQDEIPKPPSAVSVSPIRLPRYAGPTARGRPRGNVDVPAVAPSASASP